MGNRRTELRKLADVIVSNIVEKCDVTPARTIQLYTRFALQIFPHIFRLVCATFSPSFMMEPSNAILRDQPIGDEKSVHVT